MISQWCFSKCIYELIDSVNKSRIKKYDKHGQYKLTRCGDHSGGGHEGIEEVVRELGLQHRDGGEHGGGGARHVSEAHRDTEVQPLRVAPEVRELTWEDILVANAYPW